MRTLLSLTLLIVACFLAFWSVPAALAVAAAGVWVGQRASARDEEGFTRFVGALAVLGVLAEIIRQAWIALFT